MNPQEPVVPDPDGPTQDPGGPVGDPSNPDQPAEYQAAKPEDADKRDDPDDYEGYDEAVAESFPASDPPSASQPGTP